ncbi:MAG: hypothetical protein K0R17_2421 [Rariglobus sp.]|jgi:uncharacterized protein (DUF58 family)|nr:hypothetical protein [Rariglobus sp.]
MTAAPAEILDARRAGLVAAQRYRLPFGRQNWRGQPGGWQGAGIGSSIDFQDHRAYAPGDDPRYIHWSAYARTGQLTMKLYRAEVSPMVDVIADVSGSMTFTSAKVSRLESLLAFCVESADRSGAPVRVHAVNGRQVKMVPVEAVRAGDWRGRIAVTPGPGAAPGALPWRAGAMKIFISDLLYPGDPSGVLAAMAAGGGLSMVLAPALASEAAAPARGNVELVDCESGLKRRQRIDAALAERYREAYARHFALWIEAARRRGVAVARLACEGALVDVLGGEARTSGMVEVNT